MRNRSSFSKGNIVKLAGAQMLFLVALAGWVGAVGSALGFFAPPTTFQMPPGAIGDIEVDDQGRIYLLLQMSGRVQVYDRKGGFLQGWQIESRGGTMKMELGQDDRLTVVARRVYRRYVYSPSGQLLDSEEIDGNVIQRFGDGHPLEEPLPEGGTYEVRWRWLYPTVVKDVPGSKESIVFVTPFHLWLFMAPFPALLWGLSGIGFTLIIILGRRSVRDGKNSAKAASDTPAGTQ